MKLPREIRFRAWDEVSGLMIGDVSVYGDHVGFPAYDGPWLEEEQSNVAYGDNWIYLLYDYVLMQFTGLQDKDDKPIFEGDIIRTFNAIDLERGRDATYHGIVAWLDRSLAWGVVDRNGEFLELLCRVETPEVLGNVHEHPHLVEKVKQ